MPEHVSFTGQCDICQEHGATWTHTNRGAGNPPGRDCTCPTCDKPPTPLTWLRRAA